MISRWGRSPGGHGHPRQDSCLENPMDGGAWGATVQRVAQSWTRLRNLACSHSHPRLVLALRLTADSQWAQSRAPSCRRKSSEARPPEPEEGTARGPVLSHSLAHLPLPSPLLPQAVLLQRPSREFAGQHCHLRLCFWET